MSRYEALRAEILGGVGAIAPTGLVLLMARGVAAWMDHCSSLAVSGRHLPARPAVPADSAHPSSAARELVRLLADMTVATLKETSS